LQFQQERARLQVELDVSTKSRQDEWHHRRVEDAAREQVCLELRLASSVLWQRVTVL